MRDKLESLFRDFLDSLREHQALELRIPCCRSAHNAMDIDGGNQATKSCRLMDSRTTKKYVQIFAVGVLVQELLIKSKSISQRLFITNSLVYNTLLSLIYSLTHLLTHSLT
jgi:hypothetical protein